ncbi:MAG: prolyl oligopeptidase family serine peptidase, partial [Ignavibacteria bacterium]|nr:prolyl oligopeptidase family serine peptidase [Ignavibacteria bacterium]
VYGSDNLKSGPCLIFVHGFKGFKDWGFGPYIGDYFAKKGFFVITFNFSHNGIGEKKTEFTELDKFAENTFSLEVTELNEVIDAYLNSFFGGRSEKGIGIAGHSRGGAITLLTSQSRSEVKAVSVWSSISKLDRYSERQKDEWRKKGVFNVLNTRTNQVMPLNISLLEDLENNSDKLNIKSAVENLKKPLLIIHGENDLAVPINEAKQLLNWADKNNSEFFKIDKAGHTYDIKHPFEGSNPKFERVLEKTEKFFMTNLN